MATNEQAAAALLALLSIDRTILGEVEIRREGDQIILPPNMSYSEAITWMERKKKEAETYVTIDEVIEGFAFDAANAFNLAVQEMFGMKALDPFRATSQNVPINAAGDTINVFLGDMTVPGMEGAISIAVMSDWSINIRFKIRHQDRDKVKRLMALARKLVREQSIYKGKAFRLGWKPATMWAPAGFADPEFIPAETRGQMQVNRETRELVQDAVWTPIQHSAACRRLGIPLKRGVLAEGPYGTGKTLFSAETATIAQENNWTFIYLLDISRLAQAYHAARKYAPAVLFAEDVDLLMNNGEAPESVRNTIDGVDTKNSDVIVILTTNHLDKIPESILRPGRLDAVIPFRAPYPETVDLLIRQYAGKLLAPDADLAVASEKLAGQIPATIREVVERSKLHGVSRSGDDKVKLTGEDLASAAVGMAHHLSVLNRDKTTGPTPIERFGKSFGDAIVLGAVAASRNVRTGAVMDHLYRGMPDMERMVAEPDGPE